MDQSLLSSRAIMGMYFVSLEQDTMSAFLAGASNLFNSDQASETYNFLGQSPAMREWIGGRQAKGFTGQGITISNTHYEGTIEIQKKDARRDKTPQIQARIADFYTRGATHWTSLLSALLVAGTSTVCYDGQFFFDTDHSEGDSGTQDNDISVDISALPAAVHGSITAPSTEEMQQVILKAITQIQSFKDDRGEPMNENAREFLVVVPTSLYISAVAATTALVQGALAQNLNPNLLAGLKVEVVMNARVNASWTDSFAVFRTDSPIKAFIRQTEQEIELKAKAEGSEFEFDNDAWQFGTDAWRGVGYGYWQRACYVTMT